MSKSERSSIIITQRGIPPFGSHIPSKGTDVEIDFAVFAPPL